LYARVGKTISPVSGKIVKKHDVTDVVDYILSCPEKTRVLILTPLKSYHKRALEEEIKLLFQQGFTRIESKGKIIKIDSADAIEEIKGNEASINIVIDRISVSNDDDTISRMGDSVQAAFNEGQGLCVIKVFNNDEIKETTFSHKFELDGIEFEEPSLNMFSFNNPVGACPRCEGYGKVIGIDEDLVIPNKSLSVYEDAIACWRGEKMSEWKNQLISHADRFNFPIHKPIQDLSLKQKKLLWSGNQYFHGLNDFFEYLESKTYKIQYRVMLARYRGKTTCPDCNGSRLKKEAGYVKVAGTSLQELVLKPVSELKGFFEKLTFDKHDSKIAERLLREINNRINFLCNVGLGYLTLNRLSSTLSGGESQRINLATSLGSGLIGSIYILDEPSIGLHSRDTQRLIGVLDKLRDLGNTVVVVEHDEEIIRAADRVIDIGPLAGANGGEVIFQGDQKALQKDTKSLTAAYLNGTKNIEIPALRRKWNNFIEVKGARENNLKNIDVKIPLNIMTVITGVSGSGKSSLVKQVLYPALAKRFGMYGEQTGKHDKITGDLHLLHSIEFVDQNPIGKSSRSNPVTYLKAYDEIRSLFAQQQAAKVLGLKPSHFSFNVDGGRCDECQGEGRIKVEMQFMADIYLTCESCGGKRFKENILEVKYRGKSIDEILDLTVNQAIDFFSKENKTTENKIVKRLQPLQDVGLGYVHLGQASSTLSGGESQRVKLAYFLSKEKTEPTLFIFDEPTTGLHFHDINTLLKSLNALIERGHTVLIVEHNLEIIKSADWLIDLGPEGGNKGGQIVFAGKPEDIVKEEKSYTGQTLQLKITPPEK
jgi:excinuclease ABC subunit A